MNDTTLTFDIRESDQAKALARMIKELSEAGTTYDLSQGDCDPLMVTLTMTGGY
jgi:hypothetical protein